MPRRVTVPAADDLFRPSVVPSQPGPQEANAAPAPEEVARAAPHADEPPRPARGSGRVRHDEKMTVYVTSDELIDLEHARLALRRDHQVAVDRGRIVREAVAIVLADLEQHGEASALVQRLTQE